MSAHRYSRDAGSVNRATRVLCYISTRFFEGGGLSAVMLNYYRQLWSDDRYRVLLQIDIASHGEITQELNAELNAHGGKYIELPSRLRSPSRHAKCFTDLLRSGNYDVLHFNYDSGLDALELSLAHRYVPKVICHVHNTKPRYGAISNLAKPLVRKSYTDALACSDEAGISLFGKFAAYTVLNNAINLKKYGYSESTRLKARESLGIDDANTLVIGHVGRMNKANPKNTGFLLRTYVLIKELIPNSHLVIVGDGDLMSRWVKLANELGVGESVTFLGLQTNVNEWMQAFDIFCFPSRWEGLGMSAIEAQAAGLPVFASEAVPHTIALTDNVRFLAIGKGCERLWADAIASTVLTSIDRGDPLIANQIRDKGFDIVHEAERLGTLYGLTNFNESPIGVDE